MIRHFADAAALMLLLAVVSIAARIEVLNHRAGGVLPRAEYRNSDPAQGLVKWRTSPITTPERWREASGPRDAKGVPIDRSLTHTERREMEKTIAQNRANNQLREIVGTFGLLQYPLVAVLLTAGACRVLGRRRYTGGAMLLAAVGAGGLMIYRGYFSSLGW